MALNSVKCNCLKPLHIKGLKSKSTNRTDTTEHIAIRIRRSMDDNKVLSRT